MDQTGAGTPQVGALSPDGSRMWNGQFWVRVRPEAPLLESAPAARSRLWELELELDHRGYHIGKVILAAALGIILSFVPSLVPVSDLNGSNFLGFLIFGFVWHLVTWLLVVYVLSLGRQGIDVLVLRGVGAGVLLGAAVGLLSPVYLLSVWLWLLWIVIAMAVGGFGAIPSLAAPAALLNLLWYQSFESLKPQLPIFRPRDKR